jgi:ABC-2 type transport system ATP-binding protein
LNISLQNTGKKYNFNWIFRNLNLELNAPDQVGILGNNGSGKSTLAKILTGFLAPSEGTITWKLNEQDISTEIFRFTGIASPHLELIDEFSLNEILDFHLKFRKLIAGIDKRSFLDISGLGNNADKPLRHFSSGMKQRVKLLLALLSNNELIVLDEPCSNLDSRSVQWYQQIIREFAGKRLLLIASNDKDTECFSCNKFIDLANLEK